MGIYLPIAEMSANVFVLLAMGAAVGFLSGMFGVGGGFLITPLLIFYNIPPAIAVATGANQVIASSFSGALAHMKRGTLDFKLGTVLLGGGLVGSTLGAYVFAFLRAVGQLDLFISLFYVAMLGTVGGLMMVESVRALRRTRSGAAPTLKRSGQHNWVHKLPLKMRFRTSKLFVSVIPVLGLGAGIGFLAAIMGVGGGFIMVPALIYLLKVPTNVVVGTSLFQIIFVAAYTTLVHSTANQTVDVVLAFVLMVGGVRRCPIRRQGGPEAAGRAVARPACGAGSGRGPQAGVRSLSAACEPLFAQPADGVLMHKRLGLAAVLMLASMALPARAQDDARPETIEIGLSTDSVAITSNFAGADLTIFGALDNADPLVARQGRYDVIVVLEGPARPVVVRRKNRILGMWINTEIAHLRQRAGVVFGGHDARLPRHHRAQELPAAVARPRQVYLEPEEQQGRRHDDEGERFGVDPHAENAAREAYHDGAGRPFEHHDDIVSALPRNQRVALGRSPEDRQVGTGEIGGNRDAVGRQADLDALRAVACLGAGRQDHRGQHSPPPGRARKIIRTPSAA